MQVVARIQAHPDRAHLLPRLLEALEPIPVEVMTHSSDPPSPWEGYLRCISGIPDCSHLLILQDDAMPVPGFSSAIEQIAARWEQVPVVLFLSAVPGSAAARSRQVMRYKARRYIPLGPSQFLPLVAVLWPRAKAVEFYEWSQTTERRLTRADDGNAGAWMRDTKQGIMVSVPSIVEHDETAESVKGGRSHWGGDKGRVAAILAEDASLYNW